jgi:transaldolase
MKQIPELGGLSIKIFADGADKMGMMEMNANPLIKGLTTNPTLMRKAGIANYRDFAREILSEIKNKPVSFEVFSDNFDEMERQAGEIASWGENVYVKIPITNTRREYCYDLLKRLVSRKMKVNVTALMTLEQVRGVVNSIDPNVPSYVSIFAGRIADTGRDPLPIMREALDVLKQAPASELIWASPRELLNIIQADQIGCHIITVTNEILRKLPMVGYDLDNYSLDTVKMFYNDAVSAGYEL